MLYIALIFLVSGFVEFDETSEKQADRILNEFIQMHNEATDEAIQKFVEKNYHPDVLDKLDMGKQITFYQHIISEFGDLHQTVYKTMEATDTKLVVQLIKHDKTPLNSNIPETDILVVELDLHPNNEKYLARGLGLGALVCSRKK